MHKCIICINRSIENSKIYHIADDTSPLYASISLKDINKKIKFAISNLVQWLSANKIALNVNKTDIAVFGLPENKSLKN